MTRILKACVTAAANSELWLKFPIGLVSHGIAVQWVHVLALMGDTSDNVPGVPGVGAKGALSLIQEYGTVESVLANADKVRHGCRVHSMPGVTKTLSCVVDTLSIGALWPSELHLQPVWKDEGLLAVLTLLPGAHYRAFTSSPGN